MPAPSAERDADVVVVGAGVGGLVAAARLAGAGLSVVCFDGRLQPGGWWSSLQEDDLVVDLGPPFLLDLSEIQEVLGELGANLEDHVELIEVDPVLGVVFPDWERVVISANATDTAAELERFGEGDGDRYLIMVDYLAHFSRELRASERQAAPTGLRALVSATMARRPVFANRSLANYFSNALRGERARASLSMLAWLLGLPPESMPAAHAVWLARLHEGGAYRVKGGGGRLGGALAGIAMKHGAEVRLGMAVRRIEMESGRVSGVTLESGERVSAAAVLSNAHGVGTYLELLPEGTVSASRAKALQRLDLAAPPLQVALGFAGVDQPDLLYQCFVPPRLELEDAFSSMREAGAVHTKGLPMAMACPTLVDPTVAPPGTSLARILVPMPARQAQGDWLRLRDRAAAEAIALADSRFFPGLRSRVTWQGVFTPQVLAGMFRLHQRTMWPSMVQGQQGSRRLTARSQWVPGLYLAGGSTHPGPTTAGAMRSGLIAADLLLQDRGG